MGIITILKQETITAITSMTARNHASIHQSPSTETATTRSALIERLPPGYPQFTALIGSHATFNVARRFNVVRARLLLIKQQKVETLEKQLRELDLNESQELYLGSLRADKNAERIRILEELDTALASYGEPFRF
jgi:hypothetical protein